MAFVNKSQNLLKLKPTFNGSESHRMYGSVWLMIGAKWRKLINGSERVLPPSNPSQPDSILEEMHNKEPGTVPYGRRLFAKRDYMQRKSHDRIIEHNKKIRKLNKKITGGLYSNFDYANSW